MTAPIIPFQQLCQALGALPCEAEVDPKVIELRASIEAAAEQALENCGITMIDPRDVLQTGSYALMDRLPYPPAISTKLDRSAWAVILRHGPAYTAHVLRKGLKMTYGLPSIVANIAEMPTWRTALSDPTLQKALMPALLEALSDHWPSNHPEIWADLLEAAVAAEPETAEELLRQQLRASNIPEAICLLLCGVPIRQNDFLLFERIGGYFCKKYASPHARLALHQTFPSVAEVARQKDTVTQLLDTLRAEARAARGSF